MSRLILVALLATACGPKQSKEARTSSMKYTVPAPVGAWVKVKPGGADKAWFHRDYGSTIYFDSNCKERFEDGPLSDLLTHLTFGLTQNAPLREESMTLDGREALLRVYDGQVDGVGVRVGAVVTKKDMCIYDGIYIAPPSSFEDGWGSFVEVVSGFQTRRP
jgi:hypothetical protein